MMCSQAIVSCHEGAPGGFTCMVMAVASKRTENQSDRSGISRGISELAIYRAPDQKRDRAGEGHFHTGTLIFCLSLDQPDEPSPNPTQRSAYCHVYWPSLCSLPRPQDMAMMQFCGNTGEHVPGHGQRAALIEQQVVNEKD